MCDKCSGSSEAIAHLELHHVLDEYEKRFSQAIINMPERRPWIAEERAEVISIVKECLGIKDECIPRVKISNRTITAIDSFVIEHLQSTTWPGTHCSADLYLPVETGEAALPVVILACGHGKGGKRAVRYRRMAEHLVRHKIAVLVVDNIGQGERVPMGHWDPVDVFACGLSLQGLIVMETMGWLNWLKEDARFDNNRIAAIGNSGGGTLTLFLGALCSADLAAVSSSGYPCTFEFIARKEKKHCHCNLLPGLVGEVEMWQLYGCMAPKPLLLFQGLEDEFFPNDLFGQVARKVALAYENQSAATSFEAHVTAGGHSWDANRRELLTRFICKTCNIPFDISKIEEIQELAALPPCYPEWPADASTADDIARHLTGYTGPKAVGLWEVVDLDSSLCAPFSLPHMRGDVRQVLAQFELYLKKSKS